MATILHPVAPRGPARRRRLPWRVFLRTFLLAAVVVFATSPLRPPAISGDGEAAAIPLRGVQLASRYQLDERLRPLSPEQARAINLALDPTTRAGPAAAAFTLPGQVEDYRRALGCLTMAIYYEAGAESTEGQRAVAQVVLNRMRHPAFPNSVCGVVFQGSERATGCQFTFTCDGSRARAPLAGSWERAMRVAAAALAGSVFSDVGLATHYHADYVLPYWASSLSRNARVGAHIFYRWPGGEGTLAAFRQPWSGHEPSPPPFLPRAGASSLTLESIETVDGTTPPPPPPPPLLRADERTGGLIVDEQRGELLAR